MSSTLQTLIQECAAKCGYFGGTQAPSAASSSTSFTMAGSSSVFDEQDENTLLEDVWVKVEADSAGTPLNVGEVKRIKSYTASSSVVTLPTSRGFSNTPTVTQTLGFYFAIPPGTRWRNINGWTYYINRVLGSLRYRRLGLLSLVADGDMEASTTSSWTATTATLTKTTTAANVVLGPQSMRVLNSSANGLARSTAINVTPGDTYYVRADVQVASGTAVLEAYDYTQSTSLDTESSTSYDWRSLYFNFTIPSGCNQIVIRLKGSESDADAYWDNVSLYSAGVRRLELPSWIDKPWALEGVYEHRGAYSQGLKVAVSSQTLRPVPGFSIAWSQTGANPMQLQLRHALHSDGILIIQGLSRYSTLTADSSGATADDSATTVADQDLIVSGACYIAMAETKGSDSPQAKRFLAEFLGRARTTLPYRTGWLV